VGASILPQGPTAPTSYIHTEVASEPFHCHILPHAEGRDGMFGMVTALIVS